jgi:hypothetical protein
VNRIGFLSPAVIRVHLHTNRRLEIRKTDLSPGNFYTYHQSPNKSAGFFAGFGYFPYALYHKMLQNTVFMWALRLFSKHYMRNTADLQ